MIRMRKDKVVLMIWLCLIVNESVSWRISLFRDSPINQQPPKGGKEIERSSSPSIWHFCVSNQAQDSSPTAQFTATTVSHESCHKIMLNDQKDYLEWLKKLWKKVKVYHLDKSMEALETRCEGKPPHVSKKHYYEHRFDNKQMIDVFVDQSLRCPDADYQIMDLYLEEVSGTNSWLDSNSEFQIKVILIPKGFYSKLATVLKFELSHFNEKRKVYPIRIPAHSAFIDNSHTSAESKTIQDQSSKPEPYLIEIFAPTENLEDLSQKVKVLQVSRLSKESSDPRVIYGKTQKSLNSIEGDTGKVQVQNFFISISGNRELLKNNFFYVFMFPEESIPELINLDKAYYTKIAQESVGIYVKSSQEKFTLPENVAEDTRKFMFLLYRINDVSRAWNYLTKENLKPAENPDGTTRVSFDETTDLKLICTVVTADENGRKSYTDCNRKIIEFHMMDEQTAKQNRLMVKHFEPFKDKNGQRRDPQALPKSFSYYFLKEDLDLVSESYHLQNAICFDWDMNPYVLKISKGRYLQIV